MLTVTYAECHIKAPYAECRYAQCHGAGLLALATFARASRICLRSTEVAMARAPQHSA